MVRQLIKFFAVSALFFSISASSATSVEDEMAGLQALGQLGDVTDHIKSVAESSGMPIPENGLDGAKSTDLMYQTLKLIFGQPLANITLSTTNADGAGNRDDVQNPNVIVYLFSLMAGLGLIGTLISSLWTVANSLVSVSTSARLFGNGGKGEGSPFAFLVSRMGISSLLNMPLPSMGGMALSQVIMLFHALLGIGLASALFAGVATRMLDQPLITYTSQGSDEFFLQVSHAAVCLDYLADNEFIAAGDAAIQSEPKPGDEAYTRVSFGRNAECGYFDVRTKPNEVEPSFWTAFFWSGSGQDTIDAIKETYTTANFNAVAELLSSSEFFDVLAKVGDEGETFVNGVYTPSATTKNALAQSYAAFKAKQLEGLAAIQQAAATCNGQGSTSTSKLICQDEQLKESISKYGFMLAGTYSYTLNRRQSVISDLIESTYPDFAFDKDSVYSRFGLEESSYFYKGMEERYEMLAVVFNSISQTTTSSLAKDLDKLYEATTTDGGFSELMGDALYGSMREIVKVGYAGEEASFQNPEPIVQLQQIGNVMMAIPIGIIGMSAGVEFIVGMSPAGKAAQVAKKLGGKMSDKNQTKFAKLLKGSDSNLMQMLMYSLMQAIIVGGFFLGTLVPLIPYAMWNIAIFGYISYVILVVIGVPFMIAAKPLNDGEGFIGGVKTGYMMAFNVFMRPSAMVIGLVAAMMLSRVFSWWINATYFESFQIANSGSFSVGAIIGAPLGYVVLQLTAIYKAYSMINEVPAFIGKITETDRAHSDFGEEQERTRVAGLFTQTGQSMLQGTGMGRPRSR